MIDDHSPIVDDDPAGEIVARPKGNDAELFSRPAPRWFWTVLVVGAIVALALFVLAHFLNRSTAGVGVSAPGAASGELGASHSMLSRQAGPASAQPFEAGAVVINDPVDSLHKENQPDGRPRPDSFSVPSEVSDERQIQGIADCDTGAPTPSGRDNTSAAGATHYKTRRAAEKHSFPKGLAGRPVCPIVPCVWPTEDEYKKAIKRAQQQYDQEAGQ